MLFILNNITKNLVGKWGQSCILLGKRLYFQEGLIIDEIRKKVPKSNIFNLY